MKRWEDPNAEEPWTVEIESDCFKAGEPVVVSIWTQHEEDGEAGETLATPTPAQAREIAAALLDAADQADRENRRRAA